MYDGGSGAKCDLDQSMPAINLASQNRERSLSGASTSTIAEIFEKTVDRVNVNVKLSLFSSLLSLADRIPLAQEYCCYCLVPIRNPLVNQIPQLRGFPDPTNPRPSPRPNPGILAPETQLPDISSNLRYRATG